MTACRGGFTGQTQLESSHRQATHTVPTSLLITCVHQFMLAARNGRKSSIGAGSSGMLLTTMVAQQAVAKRSVGRRVTLSTCLFFGFSTALRAFTSRCDMSFAEAALPL